MSSAFHDIPETAHVAANELAFAIRDEHPVSPGHTLVVARRVVPTWFEATRDEQLAILDLIDIVKADLDAALQPEGYNVGFNAGPVAGQTVMHLHVHVIPRFRGDMDDPSGGVRHVIPSKGNHVRTARPLATGGRSDPFAAHILPLLRRATDIAIVAAFVQESGLVHIEQPLHAALRRGARVRLLTGDYLGITQADALESLLDWMGAGDTGEDDSGDDVPEQGSTWRLEVRVVETSSLPTRSRSFHPKAWRFEAADLGVAFVGSSNLSRAALGEGIEWNLRVDRDRDASAYERIKHAFEELWRPAQPLTREWTEAYARRARERPDPLPPGELFVDTPHPLPEPHAEQQTALERLRGSRETGRDRALLVFATGLGKTLCAVLDYQQRWDELDRERPPRLLFVAHRRELLLQAARAFRRLLRERDATATVGWFAESTNELHADLVFASVAKLARPTNLEALRHQQFDYVVVDEVHHAAASSYRKILEALHPGSFLLGLTATPERADGADVVGIFDDHVAHRAGVGEGISLGRLVPFHYLGIKDTIDYDNIPWRNRRFDPEQLTAAAETETRMTSLWKQWQEHPGRRTLVFCCSVTHANYVRDWLREQDVAAAAIHSGAGADDRESVLEELAEGTVQAVCTVDVLNEGVDVPAVDRVVMLRPTESNVVFLQQLGRGLRADPGSGKSALTVIDFVGNHRMFLERLRTLLSLGERGGAQDLARVLDGGALDDLPEGCTVDLELEAKDLLSRLFRKGGVDEAERTYREVRDSRDRRPRAGELLRMGVAMAGILERHGGWLAFVEGEGDLLPDERAAHERSREFLNAIERRRMHRSFALAFLAAMLEADALTGIAVSELADRGHRLMQRDPILRADLPDEHQDFEPGPSWDTFWTEKAVLPWLGGAGTRAWFRIADDRLLPAWGPDSGSVAALARLTWELVDFQLARYRRRRQADEPGRSFVCRVTWNQRDPILELPSREQHDLPEGPTDVRLVNGEIWTFRFAKESIHVARRAGMARNALPDLLRGWFGPSAGQPGTSFQVRFEAGPDAYTVGPATDATVINRPRRAIPSYPDLRAAAGHFDSGVLAADVTAIELPIDTQDRDGLFAVHVTGDSMDGGPRPLRDGDYAVFRNDRGAAPATIENRVALVQVPTEDGPPGYQVKRLVRDGAGWRLTSDNPEGPDIRADASMTVIARLVQSFRPEELCPARGARLREGELAQAFGLEAVEARDGIWGGHRFVFVDAPGRLITPSHVADGEPPRAGETAFVLAADDGGWRVLGVGRWVDEAGGWQIPEVDAATWKRWGATRGGVARHACGGAQHGAARRRHPPRLAGEGAVARRPERTGSRSRPQPPRRASHRPRGRGDERADREPHRSRVGRGRGRGGRARWRSPRRGAGQPPSLPRRDAEGLHPMDRHGMGARLVGTNPIVAAPTGRSLRGGRSRWPRVRRALPATDARRGHRHRRSQPRGNPGLWQRAEHRVRPGTRGTAGEARRARGDTARCLRGLDDHGGDAHRGEAAGR